MIPKNAELVYDGEIFKVYNWQQKLFDNSFKTFEAVKRKDSVQLIVVKDNKLIIYEEQQPDTEQLLTLPGGMIEWDEPPEKAGERELLEETGLKVEFSFYMKNAFSGKINWDTYYYICKNPLKVGEQNLDPGEKITVKEVSFEEFIGLTQHNKFRNKEFQQHIKMLKLENKLEDFKKQLGL